MELAPLAHSLPPPERGEPLSDHLSKAASAAEARGRALGLAALARAAGALHDIGKASAAFQAYITPGSEAPSPDHSTAGAREAMALYGRAGGRDLAYVIAGHHAGLADGDKLRERLDRDVPAYDDWRDHCAPPSRTEVEMGTAPLQPSPSKGFAEAFRIRMLFSCLVDADFTETARFYAAHEDPPRPLPPPLPDLTSLAEPLLVRLNTHLSELSHGGGEINGLRNRVLEHARAKSALDPGLFTLTVPTGGGKTLTSLAFALEHARRHGLRRLVYVIPYTSIIEQTADVFRKVLEGPGEDIVLEHHSSFDWEEAERSAVRTEGLQGDDGLARLRRAAEAWDAPIIVTTAVQFFESLFANRTSRCRKLHNLATSVVVLDEAQTLPLPLLRPCLAALDELARNYGSSVVLCTATQPAVRVQDKFKGGLDIPPGRELAPDPKALYGALNRVVIERREGVTADAEVAARFGEASRMLAIVNSRAHARDLFEAIRELPGATHLSTLMCPRHRREVLAGVRERLDGGAPVRLVATSLIEAGVDVSFPEVWRASTGLESVLQAAGRCNRNAELAPAKGRVVVFDPGEDHKPPHALRAFQQAAEATLRHHPDPQTLDAVLAYFQTLYWTKGEAAFDAAKLDGERFPILRRIEDERSAPPFESVARAFHMIDEAMQPVVVPWDAAAREALDRLGRMPRPLAADLRRLQQYVVPLPSRARGDWLGRGIVTQVHEALGDSMLRFREGIDLATVYDEETGVILDGHAFLSAEGLVIS